ncbi:MAG: glycoside hydrolase N-terminal domain-containing protein, partial [Prevotella sp.]|nr:glycoside hydrolase N-terminal domain-containing protein [Prevotella sp.]
MKKIFIFFSAFLLSSTIHAQDHQLWYSQPAKHWLEALPIGNSHLGAMVYGGTNEEEIQLNEETFWSGSPHNNNSLESKEHLQEVRDLIFEGKEKDAHALL